MEYGLTDNDAILLIHNLEYGLIDDDAYKANVIYMFMVSKYV